MPDLTFGEQVKLVLGRKGMTIKELAEVIEERTGKKMSRQNLTQRLGRDNFQEQDMRMIASILECPFRLSILDENTVEKQDDGTNKDKLHDEKSDNNKPEDEITEEHKTDKDKENSREEALQSCDDTKEPETGKEITVGEFLEIKETSGESEQENLLKELLAEMDSIEREGQERERERQERAKEREQYEEQHSTEKRGRWMSHLFRKKEEEKPFREYFDEDDASDDTADDNIDESNEIYDTDDDSTAESAEAYDAYGASEEDEIFESCEEDEDTDFAGGDVNPYTGKEYATNSVRMHPRRIGYVQVYNRKNHKWTDMTEWAFLGYQERKKVLLGKDYEPPIYLD